MKLFGYNITKDPVKKTKPRRKSGGQTAAPNKAAVPGRTVNNSANLTYFDALKKDGSRTPVPYQTTSLYQWIQGRNRTQLALLARWLYDNNPLVGYAVDQIMLYSTPITPQSQAAPENARAYEDYFRRWSGHGEFTGRFDFRAIQELASVALDCDGDIGFLMTAENGFPQIQIIDALRIDETGASEKHPGPPILIDGVERDEKGRIAYYWIQQADSQNRITHKRIPARELLLLYEPSRSNQLRGASPMRRGTNDARDASDIKAFEKLAVKFASSLAAVRENTEAIEPDEWNDTSAEADTMEGDESQSELAVDFATLLGGEIPVLPDGQKLNLLNTARPHQNVQEFMNTISGHFAASLGLPPAFFLDSRLTGPNQRAVIGKAQRKFNRRIMAIEKLVHWTWTRVIAYGIESGELPEDPRWHALNFQRPAKMTIDAGREAAQERADVEAGLMSRREHYGNRGLDWQEEIEELMREDETVISKAKEISERTGIDLDTILARYGWATTATTTDDSAEQDQDEDEDPEEEEENNGN